MNINFQLIFFLAISANPTTANSNQKIIELFPILELPKGIDGTLDPSLTSGLPTVVVRGFLNYMTIVDGVVIKFTKSAAMKNSITPTFPVLLIPTSVDSATATIQSTKSLNDNDVIIELNNKMGQTQVSRKKSEFHNPSSDIYPQKIPDRVTSSSNKSQITSADKLKMRMNRFKVKGADTDQFYDICLKEVCVRGRIPDSVLLVGKQRQVRKHEASTGTIKKFRSNDSSYRHPLPYRRRRLLRKRIQTRPTEMMHTEYKIYSRTIKSQMLSTTRIIRDGVTKCHTITDHFFITELVTAHKVMPNILRTTSREGVEPTARAILTNALAPTSVPSSVASSNIPYPNALLINPIEYLVRHEIEPTRLSSESDSSSSQATSSTPPLHLLPLQSWDVSGH